MATEKLTSMALSQQRHIFRKTGQLLAESRNSKDTAGNVELRLIVDSPTRGLKIRDCYTHLPGVTRGYTEGLRAD